MVCVVENQTLSKHLQVEEENGENLDFHEPHQKNT